MTPVKLATGESYEFGPFRLLPGEHRLLRQGEPVLLPPKEFELLLLLVRNAGQVMEREQLIRSLWPNTVVEEANLNVHISALRKALAENQSEQRYIETIPRLGYRFIAEVKEVTEAVPAETAVPTLLEEPTPLSVEPAPQALPPERTPAAPPILKIPLLPLWVTAMALIGVGIFALVKLYSGKESNLAPTSELNAVPLTTYPGRESQPAFSPEGNQIAFVWRAENDSNANLFVRLVDGGNYVQVTNDAGDEVSPTWSPDGRTIAFYRSSREGDGIYAVPALGGAERKVADMWPNRLAIGSHTWLHWSPLGKWLVISDKPSDQQPLSLYLLASDTGEKRRLTTPTASFVGDVSPVFSPDGKTVAFVRLMSVVAGEIYLVSVDGGEPKRLTSSGEGISSLAWTPDGREIVFSSRYGGRNRLLRVSVEGGTPQWIAASGNEALYPAFSRQGSRLAWSRPTDNTEIFRLSLPDAHPSQRLTNLISSTANEISPRYAPDGKHIAFESNRSGSNEIWVCDSEGSNPVCLTSFRGPLVGSPSWSPDGKWLAIDSRPEGNADIYVLSSTGGTPRRVTNDPAEDIVPNWSQDGRWIYFSSHRSGRLQVWKVAAEGGEAIQVTQQGGFDPMESPEGKWLYYTQDRGSSAIWRMPVGGGPEMLVHDFHERNYSRMWLVTNEGLYFAVAASPTQTSFKLFDPATGNVKVVAEIDTPLRNGVSGLTLAPDGKSLLFPVITQRGSDLMMSENFK